MVHLEKCIFAILFKVFQYYFLGHRFKSGFSCFPEVVQKRSKLFENKNTFSFKSLPNLHEMKLRGSTVPLLYRAYPSELEEMNINATERSCLQVVLMPHTGCTLN